DDGEEMVRQQWCGDGDGGVKVVVGAGCGENGGGGAWYSGSVRSGEEEYL
ncbi:hypothetical protein Tco_0701646, partial [Tanacetum coccineum]